MFEMASGGVTAAGINNTDSSAGDASCESDPNFAVICGFLERFGVHCGLGEMDFLDLQEMIENTQEVAPELIDLHIKLLRKIRKSASTERWERAAIKVCHSYNSQDAWEFERFGYKKAKLSSKLRLLKQLLEMQFDLNVKFKNEINKMSASDLRAQPLGRDKIGNAYWFQTDGSCQIRVYKEDPDEETWQLVAKDRQGLVTLISELGSGEPLPTTLTSITDSATNEDSNSLEVIDKPPIILDTGQMSDSKRTSEDGSELEEEEKIEEKSENGKSNSEKVPKDSNEAKQDRKCIETKESKKTGPIDSRVKENEKDHKEPKKKSELKEKTQLNKNADDTKAQLKNDLNKNKQKIIIKDQNEETIAKLENELYENKQKTFIKDQNETAKIAEKAIYKNKDNLLTKNNDKSLIQDEDLTSKEKKTQDETQDLSKNKQINENQEIIHDLSKSQEQCKTTKRNYDQPTHDKKDHVQSMIQIKAQAKAPKDHTMAGVKVKKFTNEIRSQAADLTMSDNKNQSGQLMTEVKIQSKVEIKEHPKSQLVAEMSKIPTGHSMAEVKTPVGHLITIKGQTKILPGHLISEIKGHSMPTTEVKTQMKIPPGNSITEIKNQPKKLLGYPMNEYKGHPGHLMTEFKGEIGHSTIDHSKAKNILMNDPKTLLSTNSQISISPIKSAMNLLSSGCKSEVKVNPSVTMLKVPISDVHVPMPQVKGLSITKTKSQYFVPKMKDQPKGHYMTEMKWGEGSSHWSPPETRGHPMEELMKMGLVRPESQGQEGQSQERPEEVKPKGLRLKPLTELLSSPQVMHGGVKEKYIRSDPFAGQMSNRKAVESYRALYTDLKRSHSYEMEQPTNILKMPRLDRPTLLGGGKNLQKPYGGEEEDEDDPDSEVGDEIEEPLMLVTGRGSGDDNKCGNFKRTDQKPESDQLCRLLNNFEVSGDRELLDFEMVLLEHHLSTPNLDEMQDLLKILCLPKEYRDDYTIFKDEHCTHNRKSQVQKYSRFNNTNVSSTLNTQNTQHVKKTSISKDESVFQDVNNQSDCTNSVLRYNLKSWVMFQKDQLVPQVKNEQFCTDIRRALFQSSYKSCGLRVQPKFEAKNYTKIGFKAKKKCNSNDDEPSILMEKTCLYIQSNPTKSGSKNPHGSRVEILHENVAASPCQIINGLKNRCSINAEKLLGNATVQATHDPKVQCSSQALQQISSSNTEHNSKSESPTENNTKCTHILFDSNSDSNVQRSGVWEADQISSSTEKHLLFSSELDILHSKDSSQLDLVYDDSPIIGETIEEEVIYVTGLGQGHCCQTGNERTTGNEQTDRGETKEETTPTKKASEEKGASFFFGSGSAFGSFGKSTAVAKTSLTFGSPVKNKRDQLQDSEPNDPDHSEIIEVESQLENQVDDREPLTDADDCDYVRAGGSCSEENNPKQKSQNLFEKEKSENNKYSCVKEKVEYEKSKSIASSIKEYDPKHEIQTPLEENQANLSVKKMTENQKTLPIFNKGATESGEDSISNNSTKESKLSEEKLNKASKITKETSDLLKTEKVYKRVEVAKTIVKTAEDVSKIFYESLDIEKKYKQLDNKLTKINAEQSDDLKDKIEDRKLRDSECLNIPKESDMVKVSKTTEIETGAAVSEELNIRNKDGESEASKSTDSGKLKINERNNKDSENLKSNKKENKIATAVCKTSQDKSIENKMTAEESKNDKSKMTENNKKLSENTKDNKIASEVSKIPEESSKDSKINEKSFAVLSKIAIEKSVDLMSNNDIKLVTEKSKIADEKSEHMKIKKNKAHIESVMLKEERQEKKMESKLSKTSDDEANIFKKTVKDNNTLQNVEVKKSIECITMNSEEKKIIKDNMLNIGKTCLKTELDINKKKPFEEIKISADGSQGVSEMVNLTSTESKVPCKESKINQKEIEVKVPKVELISTSKGLKNISKLTSKDLNDAQTSFEESRTESKVHISLKDTEETSTSDNISSKKLHINSEDNLKSSKNKHISVKDMAPSDSLKITAKAVESKAIKNSSVELSKSNITSKNVIVSSENVMMIEQTVANVSSTKNVKISREDKSRSELTCKIVTNKDKMFISSGKVKKDLGEQVKSGVRRIKVTPTRAELKMKDKSPQSKDKSSKLEEKLSNTIKDSVINKLSKPKNKTSKLEDTISKLDDKPATTKLDDKKIKQEGKSLKSGDMPPKLEGKPLQLHENSLNIGDKSSEENEDNDSAKNKKARKGRRIGDSKDKEEKPSNNEEKQENIRRHKDKKAEPENNKDKEDSLDDEAELKDNKKSVGDAESEKKVDEALKKIKTKWEVIKDDKMKDQSPIPEDNPPGTKISRKSRKSSPENKTDEKEAKTGERKSRKTSPVNNNESKSRSSPEDNSSKENLTKDNTEVTKDNLVDKHEDNKSYEEVISENKKDDNAKKPTRRSLRGKVECKEDGPSTPQSAGGKIKLSKKTEDVEEISEEKRGKGKKIAAKKINPDAEKNVDEEETVEANTGKGKKSAINKAEDESENKVEEENEETIVDTKGKGRKGAEEDHEMEKKNEESKKIDDSVKRTLPVEEGGRTTRRSKIAKKEEQDISSEDKTKKKMDEAKKSKISSENEADVEAKDVDEENSKSIAKETSKRVTRGNAKPVITPKITKATKKDAKPKLTNEAKVEDKAKVNKDVVEENEGKKATLQRKGRSGRGKKDNVESVIKQTISDPKVNDDADDEEDNEVEDNVLKKKIRGKKKSNHKSVKNKEETKKGKRGSGKMVKEKQAVVEIEDSDGEYNDDVISVPGSDDDDDISMTKDSDANYIKDDSSSLSRDIKSDTEDDKAPKKSITLATLSLDYDENATNTVGDIQNVIKQMSRSADKKRKQEEEDSDKNPSEPKTKKKKKRKTLLGLDIAEQQQNDSLTEGRGVRQSRRIAQIKIKEEAERRKVEEDTTPKEKFKHKEGKGKKRKIVVISEDDDDDEKSLPPSKKDKDEDCIPVKLYKKKRRKSNPKFDEMRPWKSSSDDTSSGEEEDEHEEELEYEEDPGSPLFKSDHEFSPESDLEEGETGLPLKRARTVKKEDAIEDEDVEDDTDCQKCGKSDHPEWILLCDGCDAGWHCSCLRPALLVIPEGDWYCPPCQHATLVKNLQEKLTEFDRRISKREIEVRRKERLAYVGISLDNVLPSKTKDESKDTRGGSSSSNSESTDTNSDRSSDSDSDSDEPIYQLRQRRKAHSYRFNDYDELINSAIQEEIKEEQPEPERHHGKDIANIINANEKNKDEDVGKSELIKSSIKSDHKDEDEEEEDFMVKKPKVIGRKKQRKLNSLDVSSEGEDSDEDFKGSTSEEDEDDFDEYDGSSDSYIKKRPTRRSTRARTSRFDRDFINDDSSYTSSEGGYKKKKRGKKKRRKNRWDSDESESISDSELSDIRSKRSKKRKQKRWLDSESESDVPRKSKKKNRNKEKVRKVKEKKPTKRRIKYGGLSSDEGDDAEYDGADDVKRRTRGKKINYIDVLGTDSDDSVRRKKAQVEEESEDEFVLNEEDNPDEEYVANSDDSDENPRLVEGVIRAGTKKGVGKGGIKRIKRAQAEEEDLFPPLEPGLEPNTIEQINKNIESVDEVMMEEEEYANRQLQMVAQQLEKEKRRKELEAARKQLLQETETATTVAMTTKTPAIVVTSMPQMARGPGAVTMSTPSGVAMTMTPMPQAPAAVPVAEAAPIAMTPPLPQGPSAVPVAMAMPRAPAVVPVAKTPTSPIRHNIPPASIAMAMTMTSMPQAPAAVPVALSPQGPTAVPVSMLTTKPVPTPRAILPPVSMKMPQPPITDPVAMTMKTAPPMPQPTAVSVAMTTAMPPQGPTAVPVAINKPPVPVAMAQSQASPIPVAMATNTPPPVSIAMTSTPPPVTVEMVQNEGKIPDMLSESPKKRGRKPKSAATPVPVVLPTEDSPSPVAMASEFSDVGPIVLNPDGTPKKRRGRGKGKKTLEKEAAAAAAAAALLTANSASLPPPDDDDNIPLTIEPPAGSGGKLGVASAPQPFSQSQPKPSVITRMLQTQPTPNSTVPPGFPPPPPQSQPQPPQQPHKFLTEGAPITGGGRPSPPVQQQQPPPPAEYMPGARGLLPPPSQPPGQFRPSLNHYPPQRAPPPLGIRPNLPLAFQPHPTHHPLDPSPSGGGQISPPISTIPGSEHPPAPLRHLTPQRQQYHPSYYSFPPPDEDQADVEPEMYPHPERNYGEEEPPNGGDEENGEFGGLVSYFSSQREDDLDT